MNLGLFHSRSIPRFFPYLSWPQAGRGLSSLWRAVWVRVGESLTILPIFTWFNPVFESQAKAISLSQCLYGSWQTPSYTLRGRKCSCQFMELLSIPVFTIPFSPLGPEVMRAARPPLPPSLAHPHHTSAAWALLLPLSASAAQSLHGMLEPQDIYRQDEEGPESLWVRRSDNKDAFLFPSKLIGFLDLRLTCPVLHW